MYLCVYIRISNENFITFDTKLYLSFGIWEGILKFVWKESAQRLKKLDEEYHLIFKEGNV